MSYKVLSARKPRRRCMFSYCLLQEGKAVLPWRGEIASPSGYEVVMLEESHLLQDIKATVTFSGNELQLFFAQYEPCPVTPYLDARIELFSTDIGGRFLVVGINLAVVLCEWNKDLSICCSH